MTALARSAVTTSAPRAARTGAASAGWSLLFAGLAVVPLLTGELTTYRVGLVLIQGTAAIGLHVLVNWSRQVSLGHAALVAVPAFIAASLSGESDLPLAVVLPLATAAGAALGALVGLPALRVRAMQVALVTLLAGVAVDRFALALPWFRRASLSQVPSVQLGPWPLFTNRALYPVLLVVFGAAVMFTRQLDQSKVARALKLLGSSDQLAQAAGVPTGRYAMFAYAYAGALAGAAGAMHAYWVTRVGTASFGLAASLLLLTIVVVGGPGSIAGPLLATVLFVSRDVPLWLPALSLMAVIVVAPEGINGLGRALRRRVENRRHR